jgi:hypothetical protein
MRSSLRTSAGEISPVRYSHTATFVSGESFRQQTMLSLRVAVRLIVWIN